MDAARGASLEPVGIFPAPVIVIVIIIVIVIVIGPHSRAGL
jgi:hypothetical protein